MDKLTFGLTMLIVGMGGTLLTLWLLGMLLGAITKLFPAEKSDTTDPKA